MKFNFLINFLSDIYVDGNHLECEGVIEMIKLLADKAEMEAIEREEKKEIMNTESIIKKPMSAVSQMVSTNVQVETDQLPQLPVSSR